MEITPRAKTWFFKKLQKTETCWLWNGWRCQGYGRIKVNAKPHLAHRISYILFKGHIPDGMAVCHSCDIKHCVNPDHLFLGTNQENTKDKIIKGRGIDSKIYCRRGHIRIKSNTRVEVSSKGTSRRCEICRKINLEKNKNHDKIAAQHSKLYCFKGHPMFGKDLMFIKSTGKQGGVARSCKSCKRLRTLRQIKS